MASGNQVSDVEACLLRALKEQLQFESFRSGQLEASSAVLSGRDALVRMPTSGGKSLCYVLPCLCFPGLSIVVSPLISLMTEQVEVWRKKLVPVVRICSETDDSLVEKLKNLNYKLVFTSPEAITSKFWRGVLAKELHSAISFIAIDEAHCVTLWGKTFRPAYQELGFLRVLFPSVPIMILSATLPPSLQHLVCNDRGLRKSYASISLPLNRSNIFYSVKKKQCLAIDFAPFVSSIQSSSSPVGVPKTVVFCVTKDVCYNVYVHLWRNVTDPTKRTWFGIYHASMSEEGKDMNQQRFMPSEMPVMVATSAFGLDIDVPDIVSVILYGCPAEGLMYCQLSGRGARDHSLKCVCELFYNNGEVKEADKNMQAACSEEACLRDLLLKSILESSESVTCAPISCCSVCANSIVPVIRTRARRTTRTGRKQLFDKVIRWISPDQKAAFKTELLNLRLIMSEHHFLMRGLDAVMPAQVIDKVVKNSSRLANAEDLLSLGVCDLLAPKVLLLLNRIAPLRSPGVQSLHDITNVTGDS